MWCQAVIEAIRAANPAEALKAYEGTCIAQLAELASMARQSIPKLFRKVLGALITIDVHARDNVTALCEAGVTSVDVCNPLTHNRGELHCTLTHGMLDRTLNGRGSYATTGKTTWTIWSCACPTRATSMLMNISAQACAWSLHP